MDQIIQLLQHYDGQLLLFIQNYLRFEQITPAVKIITHLGDKGILWIALTILLLIPRKTRRIGLVAAIALAFSFCVNDLIIKHLVNRVRPYDAIQGLVRLIGPESSTSFPSGHSSAAFATTTGILLASHKKWPVWPKLLIVFFACVIAFSRIYVGVHYPSDVIMGMVVAISCSLIGYLVFCKVELNLKKRKQERDDANALIM